MPQIWLRAFARFLILPEELHLGVPSRTAIIQDWAHQSFISCLHVLGDFNFKDIDWPDRSGSTLSQSGGQILIDVMNDHGLEQMVHFPTQEKTTMDLILTTLPGQFQNVHSPDKLSDHDIVSGNLKILIPPPPPPPPPPTWRNLGEKCIYNKKVIMNLWEKTHLSLQKKNTSVVTRILVQYRRTLNC